MNRKRRSLEHALAGVALAALALGFPPQAADIKLPAKAPYLCPVFDWTGFYIGGHIGYGRGSSNATLADPDIATSSKVFSGLIGGVQGGYNFLTPSGLLFGVEADLSFPNYLHHEPPRLRATAARSEVSRRDGTIPGPRAAGSAMPAGPGLLMSPAASPGRANASEYAYRRQRGKGDQRPPGLDGRRRI